MSSIRQTNPLQPSYQIPGHTEIYGNQASSTNNIGMTRAQSQQQLKARTTNAQKLDKFIGK
jgi:hypothetical protein